MKLHNTLSRKIEVVSPLDGKKTRIYSCGPTVYDHAHIGNLAAYIFADTLNRALANDAQNVQHVMNYTDVDDKTIQRSQRQYPELPPTEALKKLTDHYIEVFRTDMQQIGNNLQVLDFVRATDTIEDMKQLITKLHQSGFAYVADDGVYFSIEAYRKSGKKYGQLTQITASNTSSARIQNDEYDKDSVHDFALWKKQKSGEPSWKFELEGQDLTGRPGWHIECSVMSQQKLGIPFDIHTGGIDLIFPHHENEIAQSTATQKDPKMAKIFAHNNHLLVDGKKMAKSAGNFYTLTDITKKGFDPLAFRLMILQTHYRNQVHFSWENLQAAQNRLTELRAWADLRHQPSTEEMPQALDDMWGKTLENIQDCMMNDLDTPGALAALAKQVKYMENIQIPRKDGNNTAQALSYLDKLFGLQLDNRPDITDQQKRLLSQRQQARDSKDWAKSDELRDQLEKDGLLVRDTENGQIWSRC